MKQIVASVSLLPATGLDSVCSFNILVYTKDNVDVPADWQESTAHMIPDSQQLKFRQIHTSVHQVDTCVTYRSASCLWSSSQIELHCPFQIHRLGKIHSSSKISRYSFPVSNFFMFPDVFVRECLTAILAGFTTVPNNGNLWLFSCFLCINFAWDHISYSLCNRQLCSSF